MSRHPIDGAGLFSVGFKAEIHCKRLLATLNDPVLLPDTFRDLPGQLAISRFPGDPGIGNRHLTTVTLRFSQLSRTYGNSLLQQIAQQQRTHSALARHLGFNLNPSILSYH